MKGDRTEARNIQERDKERKQRDETEEIQKGGKKAAKDRDGKGLLYGLVGWTGHGRDLTLPWGTWDKPHPGPWSSKHRGE